MRWLVIPLPVLLAGCQLVFPLDDGSTPAPAACTTKATAIGDHFEPGTLHPLWTETLQGNGIREEGGVLDFEMVSQNSTATLTMDRFFDLRDSTFTFEISANTPLGGGSRVGLELRSPDLVLATNVGHALQMVLDGGDGKLHLIYRSGANLSDVDAVTYNAMTQQVWQIAEHDGAIHWLAGPRGGDLIELFSTVLDYQFTFVQPVLSAERTSQTFTATFDEMNGGVPTSDVCQSEVLRDTFDAIDPVTWGRINSANCGILSEDGQLVFRGSTAAFACSLGTSGEFDLIDHTLFVEADPAGVVGACVTELDVILFDRSRARFGIENGRLIARTFSAVGDIADRRMDPYDPIAHRFWQFRGGLGATGDEQLEWMVSSDGKTFDPYAKVGGMSGLGLARFELTAASADGSGTCVARFDNVNLAAP